MQKFKREQIRGLEDGAIIMNHFDSEVRLAVSGVYDRLIKKHWAFTSMPGVSKTTKIITILDKSGLNYHMITGKKSMRDFLYQLCFLVDSYKPTKENPLIIFIDDCEFLFADNENMNVFKVMIGKQQTATWSNNAALEGVKKLPQPMQKSILKHRLKSSEGFEFSTKHVHFIIASNIKFPTEDEAARKQATQPGKTSDRLVSKAAIGDRMNTYHIDFNSWEEQWGFVANEILQNPNFANGEFQFSLEEREQMVKFTWENFHQLKSKSFRCYEGLAQDMLRYPDTYLDKWNSSAHLDISYHKNKK
jgi:hypothetical protein